MTMNSDTKALLISLIQKQAEKDPSKAVESAFGLALYEDGKVLIERVIVAAEKDQVVRALAAANESRRLELDDQREAHKRELDLRDSDRRDRVAEENIQVAKALVHKIEGMQLSGHYEDPRHDDGHDDPRNHG